MHECVVALSGGSDSAYLLHRVIVDLRMPNDSVLGIYVNHNTEQSVIFSQKVKELCEMYNVTFTQRDIIYDNDKVSDLGLEGFWREERYRLLLLDSPDTLYTGHHLNDNTETMLLKMIRGTGVKGLTGIPNIVRNNTKIIRPNINLSKKEISEKVKALKLPYLDDFSNEDLKYSRNYIRMFLSQLRKKFPMIDENMYRLSETMSDVDKSLSDLTNMDAIKCKVNTPAEYRKLMTGNDAGMEYNGIIIPTSKIIKTKEFTELPIYRQKTLIKTLLADVFLSKNNIECIVTTINKSKGANNLRFINKNVEVISNKKVTFLTIK